MSMPPMKIVILGLSITSSWGNGHATTYRAMVKALCSLGHEVIFLERDVPWYAENRDMPEPPYGKTFLYSCLAELKDRFADDVCTADLVVVGSYVPEGIAAGEWVTGAAGGVTAFYDIDTPVTLDRLLKRECEYLSPELVGKYRLYLSFTGGPVLSLIQQKFGAQTVRPLYCSVDPDMHFPEPQEQKWDIGYLGTYSSDRQEALEKLLLQPARRWPDGRFAVAGPQYPDIIEWPVNIRHIQHLPPSEHRAFYCSQRFTLSITRASMTQAGYSPSVRLFEAAACGTPVISDYWKGLETFLLPEQEVIIAHTEEDVLRCLLKTPEEVRLQIAERARQRVLACHTGVHRAMDVIRYALEASAPARR
jgi:spore maturation protein CgeB